MPRTRRSKAPQASQENPLAQDPWEYPQSEGAQETQEETAMADERKTYNPELQEVDLSDVPAQTRAGKAAQIVQDFIDSGMKAAKVNEASPHFTVRLNTYLKAHPELNVEALSRGGVAYLRVKPTASETEA